MYTMVLGFGWGTIIEFWMEEISLLFVECVADMVHVTGTVGCSLRIE